MRVTRRPTPTSPIREYVSAGAEWRAGWRFLVTPQDRIERQLQLRDRARRLKGASGQPPAEECKVFFRVFTTQTFDTDFINSATVVTSADPCDFSVQRERSLESLSPVPEPMRGAVQRLLAAVLCHRELR